MSFKAWCASQPLILPKCEKAVLSQLANHANEDDLTWPSIDTIALLTGWKPTNVRVALRWLEVHGYNHTVGTKLGGRSKTTTYRLTLENPISVSGIAEENPTHHAVFGDV